MGIESNAGGEPACFARNNLLRAPGTKQTKRTGSVSPAFGAVPARRLSSLSKGDVPPTKKEKPRFARQRHLDRAARLSKLA